MYIDIFCSVLFHFVHPVSFYLKNIFIYVFRYRVTPMALSSHLKLLWGKDYCFQSIWIFLNWVTPEWQNITSVLTLDATGSDDSETQLGWCPELVGALFPVIWGVTQETACHWCVRNMRLLLFRSWRLCCQHEGVVPSQVSGICSRFRLKFSVNSEYICRGLIEWENFVVPLGI